MTKFWRLACAIAVGALVLSMLSAGPASAGAAHGGVVGATPSAQTPQVLDGTVLDIEQVGNRIVVAGTFTRVQDAAANGGAAWSQPYVFAFDAATGAIDRAFAPRVSGVVRTVLGGADGSVYLGGTFFTLNGQSSRNLVNVSLATGVRTAFRAPAFNGAINDLGLAGDRLFVAGIFSTVGGVSHRGLATVKAGTGALDPYMGIDVLENHNYPRGTARASVGVAKIDVSPDGRRMAVIGNFRSADGYARDQAMTVLLQAGSAVVDPNWRTRRYEAACEAKKFDSYVRDVEFSPDGSLFSIVTSGGGFSGTLCDGAAAWDSAARGQSLQPRWTSMTGGDTLLSVAVTDTAVYVGGHQKWHNNPKGGTARPGSVPRPGIAALDVRTGMPLAWNPGRNPRGIGAEALLATASGLYVGMDTEYFGDYRHRRARLGYFPLAEGGDLPSENAGQLPTNVVLAGRTAAIAGVNSNDVRSRYYDGTTAGADSPIPNAATEWSKSRGGFTVGGTLFYGYPRPGGGYGLFRRPFSGTGFGTAAQADPYNDPVWSNVGWTGPATSGTYRGGLPTFYSQLSTVSAMAYRDGRLYYTLSGSSSLYYRYFSVSSGAVSEDQFVAAATGFGSVAGLILSGDRLYFASATTGELRRVNFVNGAPSGTATVVSGPARDGRDWRARALFLSPRPNQAPTAAIAASCLELTCTFDAGGSTDRDGRVTAYRWDLGDGTTATSATVTKTYAAAGARTVRLTVTDDGAATATATRTVTVEAPAPAATNLPPEAIFTSSCAGLVCTFDAGGSTDSDGRVTGYAWDFGDRTTGAGGTVQHAYPASGDYAVTLTVTDDAGATARSTSTVPVAATPQAEGIGLRGSAGTATGTVASASVTVPDTVQAGDGLVLVLSTNSTATGTAPAGFTQAASLTVAGLNPTTQVFSRVAGGTEAGSRITVPLNKSAKVTLQLLAYSGTSATGPVASATLLGSPSGTAHTTPRVPVATSGSWVVSVWSDKQAGARRWTAPAGVTERSAVGGVGNGDIATLVADSGAPVAAGEAGGLTATVPTASNRAATATIVLAPAG